MGGPAFASGEMGGLEAAYREATLSISGHVMDYGHFPDRVIRLR